MDARVTEWSARYGIFQADTVTPYPPHDLPLARAMRGEVVHEVELFIRNPNKPEGVWISVNGGPLKDESGELRGGVIVLRDITERTRALAEIRRTRDALAEANCGLATEIEERRRMESVLLANESRYRRQQDSLLALIPHDLWEMGSIAIGLRRQRPIVTGTGKSRVFNAGFRAFPAGK